MGEITNSLILLIGVKQIKSLHMKFICALIAVSDINRSRDFYENVLNQEVTADFGNNVTYRGDFSIHLASGFKKLIDNREIQHGGNNFELYFEFDDVEKITVMLKEKGISFVHDVREQPWRQRVLRIYDPDMHIIEIGESMEYLIGRLYNEGMTPEQITESTKLPLEFVKSTISKARK
jgi:catechol 2,3-dioxygenase-like lactoylglutathione lyase family enzyme